MSELQPVKNPILSSPGAVALGAAALAGIGFLAWSILKPKPAKAAGSSTRIPSPLDESRRILEELGYEGMSGLDDFREMYNQVRSNVAKISFGGTTLLPAPAPVGSEFQIQDAPAIWRAVLLSSVLTGQVSADQWMSLVNSSKDFPDNSGYGKANLWDGVGYNDPVAASAQQELLRLLGYEPGEYSSGFANDYSKLQEWAERAGDPDAFPEVQWEDNRSFADAAVRALVVAGTAMDAIPVDSRTFEAAWALIVSHLE